MASQFMVQRRQGWYLRLRVPSDLTSILGQHFVRSLASSIRIDAQIRALSAARAAPQAWDEMRTMAATWMGKRLDEISHADALAASSDRTKALADYTALTADERATLKDRLADIIMAKADQLEDMKESVDRARAAVDMAESARQKGILEGMTRALAGMASIPIAHHPAQMITAEPEPVAGSAKLWSEHAPDYFADRPSLVKKTRESYEVAFREWTAAAKIADTAMRDLTPGHVGAYADEMRDRISKRGTALHRGSIVKNLSHVKAFLAWAVAKGHVSDKGFNKIVARTATREEKLDKPRRAFTAPELRALFDSPLFNGSKSAARRSQPGSYRSPDEDYWFLITAALTGARTEEIAFAPSALVDVEGIQCLDLREVGRKSPAGSRLVPVIPELKRLGFIDWMASQHSKGRGVVHNPRAPRTASAWSKRCNRYINDTVADDPELVLYSLRHSFRQMLRGSGISLELINKIFGHEDGSVGQGYGADLSGQEAKLVVGSVKFPVPLDHLYVRKR